MHVIAVMAGSWRIHLVMWHFSSSSWPCRHPFFIGMLRFTADLVPAEMLAKSLEPGREVKFRTLCLCRQLLISLNGRTSQTWPDTSSFSNGLLTVCKPSMAVLFIDTLQDPLGFAWGSSGGILWEHHSALWVVGSSSLSRQRKKRCKATDFQMAPQAGATVCQTFAAYAITP